MKLEVKQYQTDLQWFSESVLQVFDEGESTTTALMEVWTASIECERLLSEWKRQHQYMTVATNNRLRTTMWRFGMKSNQADVELNRRCYYDVDLMKQTLAEINNTIGNGFLV